MFTSFFPKPRWFLFSAITWSIALIFTWYLAGDYLGLLLGFQFNSPDPVIGLNHFITHEFLWFDLYFWIGVICFYLFWKFSNPHVWQLWSILGSALLIFISYASVQVSVVINAWYGPFYDDIQAALSSPNSVSSTTLYWHFLIFSSIAFPYIAFIIFNKFFTAHYIFRWRNAMNDYYVERWNKLRKIEGASQRVQEDTMRFASIMENLGVSFLDSIMTLIAFLPVLGALSVHVDTIPILGLLPYPLVLLSIAWSFFGTILMITAGIRLPGLEFKNQRVEAAFRKELVLGEDEEERGTPIELKKLFSNVKRNYFRIYFHYTYFNFFRYFYFQADNVIAYIILVPTIVTGKITLGIMNQILRAFGQVASSFQFLVFSWTSIIELISIYKRLQAFEATLGNKPLSGQDLDFLARNMEEL
jgi:peptide/bleomycin uptake transporter